MYVRSLFSEINWRVRFIGSTHFVAELCRSNNMPPFSWYSEFKILILLMKGVVDVLAVGCSEFEFTLSV